MITRARHSRAAAPESIRAEVARTNVASIKVDNLPEALAKAEELAMDDSVILVTGSLFLVGEALEIVGKKG